mgnify:CR=1 FL=1
MKAHPYLIWFLVAIVIALGLGVPLLIWTDVHAVIVVLVIINLASFLVYKLDKVLSTRQNAPRVPNLLLVLLAALGGSAGALLGIYAGREGHKTSPKYRWLRACVWLCFIVQVGLLVWYLTRSGT